MARLTCLHGENDDSRGEDPGRVPARYYLVRILRSPVAFQVTENYFC